MILADVNDNIIYEFPHVLVVSALPVDAPAAGTDFELREVTPGAWLQPVIYIFLLHFFKRCIALHAPCKQINPGCQVEAYEHLLQLLTGIL